MAKINEPQYKVEDTNHSVIYYVNLCGQTHTNTTCLGRDGDPIYDRACQQGTATDSISGQSFAVGLGDTMAFYGLQVVNLDYSE